MKLFQFFNRAEHKKHNLFNQEEVFQFTDFLQIIWNECKGEVRLKKMIQHYMKMTICDRHKKNLTGHLTVILPKNSYFCVESIQNIFRSCRMDRKLH